MRTTIFLATADGLPVISGSDGDWQAKVCLEGKSVQSVAADLSRGIIYCGTDGDGLFQSVDRGVTWKGSTSFPSKRVMALTVSHAGTVYAGTEPSEIFRSQDQGETWHDLTTLLTLPSARTWSYPPRPRTHHVQAILCDLAKPNRLHVAIEAGALLHSDDGGETWHDRFPCSPKDTHSLAANTNYPSRLHSAAGDGYFESEDSGESWRRIVDGLEHQYCWSVAAGIAEPATLLLTASKSAYAAHFKESASSFVYRRSGSDSWREVRGGLPKAEGLLVPVVAASIIEPGVFYVSAGRELYRSADDGLQWRKVVAAWNGKTSAEYAVNILIVEEG